MAAGVGENLRVRPIEPGDAAALVRFHSRLSRSTTRLRFFSVHPTLSESEVARFTTVDHHDRDALVVLDGEEIRAVARYDRRSDEEAEFAVVVEDSWQDHGIGTELLYRVCLLARRRGFRRMVVDTLNENHRMLDMLRRSGLPARTTWAAGVASVTLDLESLASS